MACLHTQPERVLRGESFILAGYARHRKRSADEAQSVEPVRRGDQRGEKI